MGEHTPTPWEAFPTEITNIFWIGPSNAIAPFNRQVCVNTEQRDFILHRINSHEAMVEVLTEFAEARANLFAHDDVEKYSAQITRAFSLLGPALAKAKGAA